MLLLLLFGRLSGFVELERKGVLSGWILELVRVSKSRWRGDLLGQFEGRLWRLIEART